MEQQVPFTVRMRHHRAIHGVKAGTSECAVDHGHSFTHSPPVGIRWMLLFNQDYIGLI
jgi:hypothetical protein